jgi:hypothetical protein
VNNQQQIEFLASWWPFIARDYGERFHMIVQANIWTNAQGFQDETFNWLVWCMTRGYKVKNGTQQRTKMKMQVVGHVLTHLQSSD